MSAPDLSVIIVSHNTKALILRAIQSVFSSVKNRRVEVIVVENASSDGSTEAIKKSFPQVILIPTTELIGFSAANNLGRTKASGTYLLFLNPDTEVLDNALDTLIDAMQRDGIRVASSGLLNHDRSSQPQGGALPNMLNLAAWMFFIDDLPFLNMLFTPYQQRRLSYFQKEHRNVGWVGGTALMITAQAFDAIGGWDEKIFLYAEDVELCLRLHKKGYRIALYPQVSILHLRQGSVGSAGPSYVKEIEGLLYIWKKWFPAWQLPVLRLVLWLGSWLRVIVFGILLSDERRKTAYLEAQKRALMA